MERKNRVTEDQKKFLKESIEVFPVKLTDSMVRQFLDYYEILIEWNVNVMDLNHGQKVIDIGTGAGFPGIPLKILFPELEVTLLDSLNKRIRFLNEVIDRLNLSGIETIHGRAEDYARRKEYREQFDLCVSRAVANLSTLSEYCIPYIKRGGFFISYKSGDVDGELKASEKAVNILGGKLEDVLKFSLPGTDINRSFVKIKKIEMTKKKYPRKAGLPGKEPL